MACYLRRIYSRWKRPFFVGSRLPERAATTNPARGEALNADVFVPELGTIADEIAHELDARGVLQDFEPHAVGAHGFFAAEERFVLADDDVRDA